LYVTCLTNLTNYYILLHYNGSTQNCLKYFVQVFIIKLGKMWMDVAQEVEQEPDVAAKSDDEDTVYDRDNDFRRNPFAGDGIERKEMLEEGETRCGIGSWRPQFLQEFVTKPSFIGVFIITGVLHGAAWSYFTASISTLEKRLKMSSETTG
jgi:hypothetical protein